VKDLKEFNIFTIAPAKHTKKFCYEIKVLMAFCLDIKTLLLSNKIRKLDKLW
jgi:hypothetical protein